MSRILVGESYVTTDGKIFTKKEDAISNQRELDLKEALTDFVYNHMWSGIDKGAVADILWEQEVELTAIYERHKEDRYQCELDFSGQKASDGA